MCVQAFMKCCCVVQSRKEAEESLAAAVASRKEAEAALAAAVVAREAAESSLKSAEEAFDAADKFLAEVKSKIGSSKGALWWIDRDLQEARKYLPQRAGGIAKK